LILCVHYPQFGAYRVNAPDSAIAQLLWEGFPLPEFATLSPETLGAFYMAFDHWLKEYQEWDSANCHVLVTSNARGVIAHVAS
jgi:hypothetical protein